METLTFHRSTFMQAPTRYKQLVYYFATKFHFVKAIANSIGSGTDLDVFAKTLTTFFSILNKNLLLINYFIDHEFQSTSSELSGSIMRGNTITSKLESEFSRRIGSDYLKELLGDIISEIMNDFDLNLTVDTTRNNIPQDILEERITEIKILCDRMLNRITSDEMINKMPRALRAICGFTRIHAEKYACKNVTALIGGFIMLRYIAPSIVTPESFGVSDDVPTVKSRANLVVIAKILQNISNCIRFEDSKKEQHMRVFDDYVISRISKLSQYYKKISHDPETENNHIPWYDFLKPLELEPEQIPLDKIGIQELFTIHRLIYQYKTKIIAALEGHDVLINLINELGPPPSISMNIQKKSFTKPSNYSMENFFYQGKPNKIGNPVFYLIVCRMDFTLFDNIGQLVTHIFQTITNAVGPTTEVSLVIDMSWASREDLRNSFLKSTSELSKIPSLINIQDKKRVKQIHLIHPMNINRVLLVFLKATTKRKTYNKIFEHEKWKTLAKYIDYDKIDLPDESKSYITKAYRVIKINAKGKKQNRVVKFTANSILNIDPKSKILKNEKLLTDIENISVTKDGEIILNFSSESVQRDANKKKGILSLSNKADLETRKYICENKSESEKFMEDIFEAALHATKLQCPQQQFKVIKVNFAGKHQERLFKLTCDSLLNLDGRKIRTEISYAGIKDIYVDKFDPRTLFILLKSETATRKIICANESERNNLYYMLARKVLEAQGEMDIEESELRHGSTELYRTTINMEK